MRAVDNRKRKRTGKGGALRDTLAEKILNVCIVFAVFVLMATVYSFVREYQEYGEGYFTEDYVISMLHYEDYAGIVNAYYGRWEDVSTDPERENISALARYIDAAFLYRALESCGMMDKAAVEKQKMDENASMLGLYAAEKANIDRAVAGN